MALDFAAGCLGGCAGIMVGYPLDTIKVHMQTQDYRNPKYKGNWHCFRTILAKESVAGLYRGMTSPLAGVAVVNAIVFGMYGQTQRQLTDPDSLSSHFIAGALAGIAQSPICSPMELAKTRMQLQGSTSQFSGPLQCLRQVYKQEGCRGVFKGLYITLLREAPSFGVYFLTYEALTRMSSNDPISTPYMLLAGGLAGTASWVISYPLDVVKSRIQADGNRCYAGILNCLKQSVKAEGYSCLYRGLSSTILRAFPTNAVTFTVVTWTFRIFGGQANEATKAKVEPGIVESVREMSKEPSLGKWNPFLISAFSSHVEMRWRYSTLSMMLMNDSVPENRTMRQTNGWLTEGLKHGADRLPRNKCDGGRNEGAREGKRIAVEENGEKKMEWSIVEQAISECSHNASRVINASDLLRPGKLFLKTDKNVFNVET